jgi:hypothetical protein
LMEVDFYFTNCWRSTRDFRPTAQASTYPFFKYSYYFNW